MTAKIEIKQVAILGAGVMGAQIGAHFANAGISVTLFDLKANSDDTYAILHNAINVLQKLNPKPIASNSVLKYITIANYDDDLQLLKQCDLVIEAIAERLDLKQQLYSKIAAYVEHAIIASNTSGISIQELANALPQKLRSNFCGIHFFNPPRYMPLVELTPHLNTNVNILPQLETFLVRNLGKSVIVAKDTPNFIANRLGIFAMLSVCVNAEKFNIPFEVVDQLTGKNLGRAKSATFRTADVVGLDTFSHVVNTLTEHCKDGFENIYVVPQWMQQLIKKGALGAKTKAGIFTKDKDGIKVIDLATLEYRIADKLANPEILKVLRGRNWADKFTFLKQSSHPEAQFLWASFRDIFQYASILLGEITDSPRNMDFALRWGFGWKEGIFEIWQQGGWQQIAQWVQQDIDAGKSISTQALPKWVQQYPNGIYQENKYFDIAQNTLVQRQELPVYSRQLFPDLILNEVASIKMQVLYENNAVTLWHSGDNIGILSFKTKLGVISQEVLHGIEASLNYAEQNCVAMVIWQSQDVFSVGANLEEFGVAMVQSDPASKIGDIISLGHNILAGRLHYSKIPVVAAVKGYALGGGCEIMLHCSAVVAALESYIGLVEAGVGLLPGWGGTTEMAYRASLTNNPWQDLQRRFKYVALGQLAGSAIEAKEMGLIRESDTIVMNSREILYIAKERAKVLADSGYTPPQLQTWSAFGEQGIANIKGLLVNMQVAEQISTHDMLIAENIAHVMCGGMIEQGQSVDQNWVLNIEKNKFVQLAVTQATAQRVKHMLETGKPLRN